MIKQKIQFIFCFVCFILTATSLQAHEDAYLGWFPKFEGVSEIVLFHLRSDHVCKDSQTTSPEYCPLIETISWYVGNAMQELPKLSYDEVKPESQIYIEKYFSPKTKYWLTNFEGGNQVEVNKTELVGCVSLAATVDSKRPIANKHRSLASNVPFKSNRVSMQIGQYSSELKVLQEVAYKDFMQQSKLSKPSSLSVVTQDVVYGQDQVPAWLVVELNGDYKQEQCVDCAAQYYNSIWVYDLAKKKVLLQKSTYLDESYHMGISLVDAVDLDSDAVPELVFEVRQYESSSYEIYKIIKQRLQLVYKGGGSGC